MSNMTLKEIFEGLQNKTLQVGFRFSLDVSSGLKPIGFPRERKTRQYYGSGGNVAYTIEVLEDDFYVPLDLQIEEKSVESYLNEEDKKLSLQGFSFREVLEYQSDHNLHVVQCERLENLRGIEPILLFEYHNEGVMCLTGNGRQKSKDMAVKLFNKVLTYQGNSSSFVPIKELSREMLGRLGESVPSAPSKPGSDWLQSTL